MMRRLASPLRNGLVVVVCASALAAPERADCAPTEIKLRASDKSQSAEFGTSVALRGDVALVGAPEIGAAGNGAAYVFRFDGSSWNEEQKLVAPDASAGAAFGASVALGAEDLALVSAHFDDETATDAGAAYVFRHNGTAWVFEQKLRASDGVNNDEFANSVAMNGTTAVIGARRDNHTSLSDPGAAYVFSFNGSMWLEASKHTAPDAAANDELGISVALEGASIVAGAWGDDDGGSRSGSAYDFGGVTPQKRVAFDAAANDEFGVDVAVHGDALLVGARGDDDGGVNAGSAYLFRDSGGSWAFEQKLFASDRNGSEDYGHAVALDQDIAVVGARLDDDNGGNSGSVYVHRFGGSTWTEAYKLLASDADGGDEFGYDVAVDGNRVLVGARLDDDPTNAGSAYVIELPAPAVPALPWVGFGALTLALLTAGVRATRA